MAFPEGHEGGNPRFWRMRKELLNPGEGWRRLAKFNPRLPLSAAGLSSEQQEMIHENLKESEELRVGQDVLENIGDGGEA